MRSLSHIPFAVLGGIVLVTAFANANAPGDQYQTFSAQQPFIDDGKTHLQWQRFPDTSQKYTHTQAQLSCPAYQTGYRLPTVRELLTLVDEDPDDQWDPDAGQQVQVHIDPNAFPATPPAAFWTMSPATTPGDFKVVNFADGQTRNSIPAEMAYVRCVMDN